MASAKEDDEKQDVMTRKAIKLYQCSDEDGTLRIREVKGGPLEQGDLLSKDSFIVDNGKPLDHDMTILSTLFGYPFTGNYGIWVWVGKRASPKERTEAMRNAQGFIKKKGESLNLSITNSIVK